MDDRHVDELVRRFDAGDRDQALLRQIQRLAAFWFHDSDDGIRQGESLEAEGGDGPEPIEDPEGLSPLSTRTVERWLEARGLKHQCGEGGVYLVVWDYARSCDRTLRANIAVEGLHRTVLRVSIFGDRRVDAERFPEAHACCNRWNETRRWPRAFLVPSLEPADRREQQPEPPLSGILVLDFQMPLEAGIAQAQFDSLLDHLVASARRFFDAAWKDYRL